jgi:hypothetical protein
MKSLLVLEMLGCLFLPQAGCRAATAGAPLLEGLPATQARALLLPWNDQGASPGFSAGGPEAQPRGPMALACSEEGFILDDPLNHRLLFLNGDGSLLVQRDLVDDVADLYPEGPGRALVLSPGRSRVAAYGPRGAVARVSLPLAFLFPLLLLPGPQGLEVSSAFGETWRLADGYFQEGLPLGDGQRVRLRGELAEDGQRVFVLDFLAQGGELGGLASRSLPLPFQGRSARFLGDAGRGLVFLLERDDPEGLTRELWLCDPGVRRCRHRALASPGPYQPRKQVALCRGGGLAWLEPQARGLVIRSLGPEAFPPQPPREEAP